MKAGGHQCGAQSEAKAALRPVPWLAASLAGLLLDSGQPVRGNGRTLEGGRAKAVSLSALVYRSGVMGSAGCCCGGSAPGGGVPGGGGSGR
jgi:hypothetical protein